MNESHDPNETRDQGNTAGGADPDETVHQISDDSLGSLAADSLEVGLAAAFGKNPGPSRSSIGDLRSVLLKEPE